MDDIVGHLERVRTHIDEADGLPSRQSIDDLLVQTGLSGEHLEHAKDFAHTYRSGIAHEIAGLDIVFEKEIKKAGTRDKGSYPRLVYNSLVPAVSLGLVTSSIGGAVIGLLAGLGVDIVNQRYWKNVASPANVGWWALAGGVVGATIDYFADTSMPIFTYIIPAVTGTLSGIVEASEVFHRETQGTIRERQREVHMCGQKQGDELVQKYAKIMSECE